MEEGSEGVWNGPFHYCEFWTAEPWPGQRACDRKAKEPYDCCSGRGGRYIVQENNIMMDMKGPLGGLPPYRSCKEAELATEGRARCDLPGYDTWYYSTGNLYRKTFSARFGSSSERFNALYREAILIEALRPTYVSVMNTTFDRGNHSAVLNVLGVPHYHPHLQEKQSDINYYYYEFYNDLATRNARTTEELVADFADCFFSPCNDDCIRGTNEDLKACTDIIPELLGELGTPDPEAVPEDTTA